MVFLFGVFLNGCNEPPTSIKNDVAPQPAEDLWSRKQGEDWASFLGPRADGTSLEKGIVPDQWKPQPKLLWKLSLGMSYGGPCVVKGRVLQFDRENERERLRCLNAESGKLIWEWSEEVIYADMYGYNSGPRCMPVVDNDLVYTYGVTGRLSCITLADGKLVWQHDLSKQFGVIQNFFGVASTPAISGDKLIVMVGGSPEESRFVPMGRLDQVKPNGSAIVVFDKRTGDKLYQVGNDLASYSSPRIATLNGKALGLAFARGGLLAWDVDSGKEQFYFPWRSPKLESVNAAQPVVHDNEIFISETYEIGSTLLKVENGQPQIVWQDGTRRSEQAFRAHWSTPVLIDGYLYGCSGRNQPDSDFRCIRWSDGEVMWSVRQHQRASVLSVDGYLVVLYENGQLDLVRPTTEKYEVLATVDLDRINAPEDGMPLAKEPCWAAPVLSHGLLFIRGDDRLLCFDVIPNP